MEYPDERNVQVQQILPLRNLSALSSHLEIATPNPVAPNLPLRNLNKLKHKLLRTSRVQREPGVKKAFLLPHRISQ